MPFAAAAFCPAPEGLGNELRSVVTTDERLCWLNACELLNQRHYVFYLAAPAHPGGMAETALLVDRADQLESPADGRGVELDVHAPGLVLGSAW